MGPKWYLAKAIDDGRGCRVIGGLEVRNTMDRRSVNGINPRFRIGDQYTLNPISATGGSAITVSGVPVLKMVRESAVAVGEIRQTSSSTTPFIFSSAYCIILRTFAIIVSFSIISKSLSYTLG